MNKVLRITIKATGLFCFAVFTTSCTLNATQQSQANANFKATLSTIPEAVIMQCNSDDSDIDNKVRCQFRLDQPATATTPLVRGVIQEMDCNYVKRAMCTVYNPLKAVN